MALGALDGVSMVVMAILLVASDRLILGLWAVRGPPELGVEPTRLVTSKYRELCGARPIGAFRRKRGDRAALEQRQPAALVGALDIDWPAHARLPPAARKSSTPLK